MRGRKKFEKDIKRASNKEKTLIKCVAKIDTIGLEEETIETVFKKKNIVLTNELRPEKEWLVEVDQASEEFLGGTGTRSKRSLATANIEDIMGKLGEAYFESVEVLAIEGSTLTFLGHLVHDTKTDKIILKPIAFGAGGLQ